MNRIPYCSPKFLSVKGQFLIYLIGMITLAMSSCSSQTEAEANGEERETDSSRNTLFITQKQFQSSDMALGKMELDTFTQVVKAKGMLDVPPENRAEVSSYFGGTVRKMELLPGERVHKGQTLFVLENPDYLQIQQDFLENKGQLAYYQSDFERQKNLAADSISSQKKFLKAKADYTTTVATLASLRKKLTLMGIDPQQLTEESLQTTISISSPINGFVTEVAISQGAFLTPSQPAVKIVNTDHIHLELSVFERDIPNIAVGQDIEFRLQQGEAKSYAATIYLINKVVDPEKRTLGVHGHIVDERLAKKLNPGMYVEAEIYTDSAQRKALPQQAVVNLEGKYFVLQLESRTDTGYTFVRKEVETGLKKGDQIEIIHAETLREGAEFLTKGAFNLITE